MYKPLCQTILILLSAFCCLSVKASAKLARVGMTCTEQCSWNASMTARVAPHAEPAIAVMRRVSGHRSQPTPVKPFTSDIYSSNYWFAQAGWHVVKQSAPFGFDVPYLRTSKLMLFPFHGFW